MNVENPEITPVLDKLCAQAYERQINYLLRDDPLWRRFLSGPPAPPPTRRQRFRRWRHRQWDGFRYRLAKRIYDFPEEPW